MSVYLVALFIFLGIVLIIIEILFIPGFGIPGIIGAILIFLGIYFGFQISTFVGLVASFAGLAAFVILAKMAFRDKTWSKLSVKSIIDGKSGMNQNMNIQEGEIGISISRISPMGKANFSGNVFEVKTIDGFIAENTQIKVKSIKGMNIIVQELNN